MRAGEGRDDVRPPIAVSAAIATAAATGGGAGRGRGRPREGGEREQQPGSHGVPPPAWVCGPRGAATPFELSSPFAWGGSIGRRRAVRGAVNRGPLWDSQIWLVWVYGGLGTISNVSLAHGPTNST